MKEYLIKKGYHSGHHPVKIHKDAKRLIVDFMFTDSCAYDVGSSLQFHWNKVFGLKWGFLNKKNFYQIGSRYDTISKRLQLSHYYSNNNKKEDHCMCAVEINQPIRSIMSFSRSTNTIWNRIIIFENEVEKVLYEGNINFDFRKVKKTGVILYPTQADELPAQHDTKYLIDYKF